MANQLQNKQVEQEIVVASGMIPRSPVVVPIVCNGGTSSQAAEATSKSDKQPEQRVGMVYTSALSSNLSQLAELAANQAPSQMGHFVPTSFQPFQPGLGPGNTKFVVPGQGIPLPGQGIPLPLGPQQIPLYGPLSQSPGVPLPTNIPPPFQKGSIIQLKSGELKRVEDLKTEDFVHSVDLCPELKLETSTVITIRKNDEVGMALIGFSINSTKAQVTLSCAVEHPFFVCEQGWSACVPEKSLQKFSLICNHLKVGDTCIFLSPNAAHVPITISGIPQGQILSASGAPPRLPHPLASASRPGQMLQGNLVNQIQASSENLSLGSSPLPMNTVVFKQSHPPNVPSAVSQALASVTQQPIPTVTTASPLPSSTALIFDPQLGILRPQSLGSQMYFNQQLLGASLDPKTVPLQGGLPPYYQTVPASLVGSVPTTTVVQSPAVQGQAGVGNGLLVTVVPGMNPTPGMVYASQLSEMAQKQGHENRAEMSQALNSESEQRADSQSDTVAPAAKKTKLDGQ